MEDSVLEFGLRWGAAGSATLLLAQGVCSLVLGEHVAEEREANEDGSLIWREEAGVTKLVPKFPARSGAEASERLAKYTMREVSGHNTRGDMWIVVDGLVYDVTRFVDKHPGGPLPIENMAGKDCTDAFANYHAARVYKNMLPAFLIGEASDYKEGICPHVMDFRAVRQELLRRGLFETDPRFYAKMGTWYVFLFSSALHLSLYGQWSTRLAGAVLMGVFWQQLAGLGHDLGHSGVTHVFWKDHLIGSVLASLMGISTCWWKRNHNTHHIVCNSIENDPDIQHMPICAVTPEVWSKPYWSTYYEKWVAMDSFGHWAVSHQDRLYLLVMSLARFNLYVQSVAHLLSKNAMHYRKTELIAFIVYFSWLSAVVLSQKYVIVGVLWLLISHATSGLLHVQITTSHWAMETYHGRAYNDEKDEWYMTQLKTTMNIDTHPWLDWVHIGLQFQIEHHIYPRLPRHSLRKARVLVKAVCEKHGIGYHEPGFIEAVGETLQALAAAAKHARVSKRGKSGFYESALWDGLTLTG
mmetsp:Transcript_69868/g.195841  ORF Transcript_69868/g.195841 Transcript_69868/m.195841 type:complete len:524 (-) Transcript_69868:102-1673(-)